MEIQHISFPIKDAKPGAVPKHEGGPYALIITDANDVQHYFTYDGEYDGWSCPPCTDGHTGTCLN